MLLCFKACREFCQTQLMLGKTFGFIGRKNGLGGTQDDWCNFGPLQAIQERMAYGSS